MNSPAPRPKRHWFAIIFWLFMTAGAYGVYSGVIVIPEPFNPWAPLDVNAPSNALTAYKLARTRSDPGLCADALTQTGMKYELLPNRTTGPGCGFDNAVRLREAGVRLGVPVSLSCPMALSFFMWKKHVLQPAALQHFGQRVVAIEHLGSYACRDINRGEGVASGSPAALCLSQPPCNRQRARHCRFYPGKRQAHFHPEAMAGRRDDGTTTC